MNTQKEIEEYIKLLISKEINTPVAEIAADEPFMHFGIDSMRAVAFLYALEKQYSLELNPLMFWDYPTAATLSKHLLQRIQEAKP